MRACSTVLAASLSLFLVACSTATTGPDGGTHPDGAPPDAGFDGGSEDGGGSVPPWPTRPEDYEASLLTYIHDLKKPAKVGITYACCRDFGAISRDKIEEQRDDIDNAVASFFDALSLLTSIDLQQQIDDNLASGNLLILFDHWGYAAPDTPFFLPRLEGAFAGTTTYAEAAAGNGTFTLDRESFLPGTGTPKDVLDATISSLGEMHATGDGFRITLGLYGAPLTMTVHDPVLDATADETSTTIAYRRGKMSGFITVQDFFDALNGYVAKQCACLGLSGPLFSQAADGTWSGACVTDAASLCTAAGESFCVTIGDDDPLGSCTLTPQILPDAADIDLDGDPTTFEALSMGFTWASQPARAVGLTP